MPWLQTRSTTNKADVPYNSHALDPRSAGGGFLLLKCCQGSLQQTPEVGKAQALAEGGARVHRHRL